MGLPTTIANNTAGADRPDNFQEDFDQPTHFPCGMCVHRDKPVREFCTGCRFYFN